MIYQRGSPGKISASPLSFKLLQKLSFVLYPSEKKPIPVKIVRYKSPVKILKSSGALDRDVRYIPRWTFYWASTTENFISSAPSAFLVGQYVNKWWEGMILVLYSTIFDHSYPSVCMSIHRADAIFICKYRNLICSFICFKKSHIRLTL